MSKKSYINDPTILLFFWSCPLMVCTLWHVYPCWWLISLDRLFPKCVRVSLRDSWQWHSYMHRTLVCVALNSNYFSLLVCFICKVIPHWWNSLGIRFHTLSYQSTFVSIILVRSTHELKFVCKCLILGVSIEPIVCHRVIVSKDFQVPKHRTNGQITSVRGFCSL